MYVISEKDYCKYPRVIDVINNKPIIGYFRCPKCKKSQSIGIHEIYSNGEIKGHLECSCGFIDTIKLKNWENKKGELKI